MSEVLSLTREGAVAVITLNRADNGNAINPDLAAELVKAAIAVDMDSSVRCVVLTGAGKLFCAGGDITVMESAGDKVGAGLSELAGTLHMASTRMARMDKPLICAVNGPAAGAGLGMAIMGDIVLAARSAHFTPAYTAIGLTPDGGATFLLPRLIGLRRAQEMLITNRRIGAEEGAAIGLVTRMVEDEVLMEEAMALATKLAAGPTRAYGVVRAQLLASYGADFEKQLEVEARGIAWSGVGADGQEGVKAYMEKRKAVFTGQA